MMLPIASIHFLKTGPEACVGPGLQNFGLITLPLVINYALLGELKSVRAQSVGEVSAY